MIRPLSRIIPPKMRMEIRKNLVELLGGTVSQGYEKYAKTFKAEPGKYLGDEWNEPDVIGLNVAPNQIVPTLDRMIFQPFLGTCDVILEIGAGGGRFTEILFPKCNKVIATDTSPTMLYHLKQRFKDWPKLECIQLDGRGLEPIEDQSVDAAFSYDVFDHLEQWDIFNYLCELKRVLKPGGKAIIHHSNTFSELGWKRFVSDMPQQINVPKIWGTLSMMTPEVFKELSERAGLSHIDCITDVVQRDGISLLQSPIDIPSLKRDQLSLVNAE